MLLKHLEQIKATGTRMTMEEIEATPIWKRGRPRPKMFCQTFIQNGGDLLAATQAAYQCKDKKKNFQVQSYQVLESPWVQKILNMHFGRSEKDILIAAWEKRLTASLQGGKKITTAELRGMQLLCRLRGWTAPSADGLETDVEPEIISETPKSLVPTGCDPIVKAGKVIGYFTPEDQRVDF